MGSEVHSDSEWNSVSEFDAQPDYNDYNAQPEFNTKDPDQFGQSLRELESRHRADEKKNDVATAGIKSSALSSVTVAERLSNRSGVNPADRSFVSVSVKCSLMPDDVSQLGGQEMAQKAIQEFTDLWTKKYQADVFDFIRIRKQMISKIPDDLPGSMEDRLASEDSVLEGDYSDNSKGVV